MRYPLAPLCRAAGIDPDAEGEPDGPLAGLALLAARLRHYDAGNLRRHRRHGISRDTADRYAIALGLHPGHVWGMQWWTDTEGDAEWFTDDHADDLELDQTG